MLTDYKISRLLRYDDGSGVAHVRFYEGEITTLPGLDIDGNTVDVTCYRRAAKLRDVLYQLEGRTDAELTQFLNTELAQDGSRTSIPEQRNA
jgi:hypothetical protein